VSGFEKLTPAQQQGQPPKALLALDAKIPQLFPQGPGDAFQSAANPCVQATGDPGKAACPKQDPQPDFDGTQSFYNSGWLDSKARFTSSSRSRRHRARTTSSACSIREG